MTNATPALQRKASRDDAAGSASARRLNSVPELTGKVGRFLDVSPEKMRGGYYTPEMICAWMAQWALRRSTDSFLEPSCGDGNLIAAGAKRLIQLGCDTVQVARQIVGIEVSETEAGKARSRLAATAGVSGGADERAILNAEFFSWWESANRSNPQRFNAILGNPPFLRYQAFPEPARSSAMSLLQRFGLRPNKLTNAWVPFVVASAEMLVEGGRMALVVPAELLQVSYARQLRSYLTSRFRAVYVLACNDLLFSNAEQEIVILLADGARGVHDSADECHVRFMDVGRSDWFTDPDTFGRLEACEPKRVCNDSEKWLKYFLSASEIGLMRELRAAEQIISLGEVASVDVGIVTGKNDFFVISEQQAKAAGIFRHTRPIVGRAAHLKGAMFDERDWSGLSDAGDRVHLVDFGSAKGPIGKNALAYIADGEASDFHTGYKCRIRKPWYFVPSIWSPQAFLFRQIHDFPRFVLNNSDATCTDTIHRLNTSRNVSALLASCYTYLTASSSEIEGRSYGGGVLELEPTEAERLLIPRCDRAVVPLAVADAMIRSGRLDELLAENSKLVLKDGIGLSESDLTALRSIYEKMRQRRGARSRMAKSK